MAATTKTVSAAKTTTAAPKTTTAAPKTESAASVEASGAIIEEVAKEVDLKHPAVDSNPRANAPDHASLIDFNDPTISAKEAVSKNLAAAADADVDQAD